MSYIPALQEFTGETATTMRCWCSIQFVIPRSLFDYYKRMDGAWSLHCPLGHTMVPAGQSEADKVRDELTREKHRAEQARAEADSWRRRNAVTDRQLSARKGQITKIKNRIARGVCPACNRTFENVGRHMATKHPTFAAPEPEHTHG